MSPRNSPLIALLLSLWLLPASAGADDRQERGPMVLYSVQAEFGEARDGISEAIVNQGMVISTVLHASDMLNRTGPDLGIKHEVYSHAETFEFCKADLSHQLVAIDPANMMACPYAIGVYVLTDQPDTVWLAYRKPSGVPGSEAVTDKIIELLETVIDDALEFL